VLSVHARATLGHRYPHLDTHLQSLKDAHQETVGREANFEGAFTVALCQRQTRTVDTASRGRPPSSSASWSRACYARATSARNDSRARKIQGGLVATDTVAGTSHHDGPDQVVVHRLLPRRHWRFGGHEERNRPSRDRRSVPVDPSFDRPLCAAKADLEPPATPNWAKARQPSAQMQNYLMPESSLPHGMAAAVRMQVAVNPYTSVAPAANNVSQSGVRCNGSRLATMHVRVSDRARSVLASTSTRSRSR